mgnify:CR=1 FL=1
MSIKIGVLLMFVCFDPVVFMKSPYAAICLSVSLFSYLLLYFKQFMLYYFYYCCTRMIQMIIDFHTHCFPEKIAAKALAGLASCSGSIIPYHEGSEQSLLKTIKTMGADMAVVLNIATNPRQQKSVNDYAIRLNSLEGLTAFGSVHPDSPDALEELERIKQAGIKGIKFHPDYQNFFVEDKRLFPLYKKAAELGLITVFHAGVDIGLPNPVHCTPIGLSEILPLFVGTPVVAAHFGGYMMRNETLRYLTGKDIYLDTSYSHSRFPAPWAKEIIEKHGAKKILLGSDMPWSRTDYEINFIKGLHLPDEDTNLILGGNAQRILKIGA